MAFLKSLKADPKRGALMAVALICVLGGSLLVRVGPTPWAMARSTDIAANARSSAQSEPSFQTLSDFINRSPGERGEVDAISGLIKSASLFEQDGSSPLEPSQRALGKIFRPEPFSIAAAQQGPIDFLTGPLGVIGAPGAFDPATDPSSGFPPGGGAGPGGSPVTFPPSIAPGGGGGIGGGGGNGGGSVPPPPVAGVPEPSTWALMLIGFFAAGSGMRRNNSRMRRPNEQVAL